MSEATTYLELRDLRVSYGKVEALHGISVHVEQGEIVTILGANGAGKTTTLTTISGLRKPSGGSILFQGRPLHTIPSHEIVRLGITQSPEGRRVFGTLSVRENLDLGAFTSKDRGRSAKIRKWIFDLFPRLAEREGQLAGTLSGGEQQMLAIARALMLEPELLLFDEPTSALDPQSTQSILGLIRDIHDRLGITVIVITHQMSVVEQICTRVAILDGGEVAEEGKVSEVFAAPQSQAAKRLVYPEGYEQPVVRFDEGKMLRVVFNGAKATKTPLIAQMALDCGITASILGASTKGIGEKAYGNMLLGIPGGDAELQRAMDYLRSIPDIFVEEVDGHV